MVLKQRWTRKTLKMRLHMQKYATYVRIYVNFWICSICSIIFAYAILKMSLYAKKCDMRVLAKYAIAY